MMKKIFTVLFVFVGLIGCENLEFPPKTKMLKEEAIQTGDDLQLILNAAYDVVGNTVNGNAQKYHELLSDNVEAPQSNDDFDEVYSHNMLFFNSSIGNFYGEFYVAIFRVNTILENFDFVTGLTEQQRIALEAEGRFLRALCHFEVARLFAHPYGYTADNSHPGVAVVLESIREPIARSTVAETYEKIIEDLEFAIANLKEDNGIYASKYAAKGLLAKVYLNQLEYQKAADQCSDIISSGLFSLTSGSRFVIDGTTEDIFKIKSETSNNRSGGYRNNWSSSIKNPTLIASTELFNIFDTADARLNWFVPENLGTPTEQIKLNKFDNQVFDVPFLNLTEILLTRAEALAMINSDKQTIVDDVNQIIERAYGVGRNTVSATQGYSSLLERVQLERRKEFVGEGDWMSVMKRKGLNGETVQVRNDNWDCNGMILQFPIAEKNELFELNETGGC